MDHTKIMVLSLLGIQMGCYAQEPRTERHFPLQPIERQIDPHAGPTSTITFKTIYVLKYSCRSRQYTGSDRHQIYNIKRKAEQYGLDTSLRILRNRGPDVPNSPFANPFDPDNRSNDLYVLSYWANNKSKTFEIKENAELWGFNLQEFGCNTHIVEETIVERDGN